MSTGLLPKGDDPSPWHPGEVALQRSVGVVDRMDARGRRVIRDHLTAQQREFFANLPYVLIGSVDPDGQPWATLRDGDVGFIRVENERRLHIGSARRPLDPAQSGISNGSAIAMLGIQFETRRRNRANGAVANATRSGFDIRVEHSFGNCAQYIWLRDRLPDWTKNAREDEYAQISDGLGAGHIAMIRRADTFFVASYADREAGDRQADVSHRGGRSGFVNVSDDGWLTIPDYSGNNFFNTLGNILVNGKAGLSFPDYAGGTLLQMTGDAEIVPASGRNICAPGVKRHWRFRPRRVVQRSHAISLSWKLSAAPSPSFPEDHLATLWTNDDPTIT
jgi:predicted pyridoxine 5'-phosphate oxidase superfamily flavin-nucleotide-binding protein